MKLSKPPQLARQLTITVRRAFGASPAAPATGLCLALVAWLFAGCTAPIGADRASTSQVYSDVDANALITGKPSASTVSLLHRYDLDRVAASHPEEAVRQLHQKALASGDRELLFALAEMSYVAGNRISRSVKPWDPRDARDYYLGSAVYAWLFLFGEGKQPPPDAFDRRFRQACDFYNYNLGLAFTERKNTNAIVRLENGRRRLPVGEIEVRFNQAEIASGPGEFDQMLLADQFRVRGLSVRNREAGVGAPLIAVSPFDAALGVRRAVPATILLRVQASLADLGTGTNAATLEFYSSFETTSTTIGRSQVPLETDLTAFRAWTLNQSKIWSLGPLQFLAPDEHVRSQLLLNQPYTPGRIPVVFVHGTFSSPVTWAEMANTLTADPVLRQRYQFWSFNYSSGNPLPYSINELRNALTAEVQGLDPDGKDPALRQMIIIGHSQGGLLTKATAIDTGDRIWRLVSTNRLEDLKISETNRARLRSLLFLTPLPFVSRVVFIATPHRGSYLSGGFARRWARRLVSLPGNMVSRGSDLLRQTQGSQAEKFLNGKMPTSLDSMSPKNPMLLAMAEIPVLPPIKANSIIAVQGDGDFHQGRDGLVAYDSAHVNYAESEFIVRSFHSCLDQPATIEEVRRILHEHLDQLSRGGSGTNNLPAAGAGTTHTSNTGVGDRELK